MLSPKFLSILETEVIVKILANPTHATLESVRKDNELIHQQLKAELERRQSAK